MSQFTFGKLAYIRGLRSGGFAEAQAEAATQVLDGALQNVVATRSDVPLVKIEPDAKIE